MKHIIVALILSISLHLGIIYFLKNNPIETSHEQSTTKIEKKSNVHYVKLRAKPKKNIKQIKN